MENRKATINEWECFLLGIASGLICGALIGVYI